MALGVVLLLSGCGEPPTGTADDPEKAAAQAFDTDCDDVGVWATERFIQTSLTCGEGDIEPGEVIVEFTDLLDNDDAEATVTLTTTWDGQPALFNVHLLKQDGLWKVDLLLE